MRASFTRCRRVGVEGMRVVVVFKEALMSPCHENRRAAVHDSRCPTHLPSDSFENANLISNFTPKALHLLHES
jgi:hypothetical protein